MHKYIIHVFSLFLLMMFTACDGKQEQSKEEQTTMEETVTEESAEMAENVIDCDGGCGMKMEKEKMVMHVHEGDTLYFCSEKCMEHYLSAEHHEAPQEM